MDCNIKYEATQGWTERLASKDTELAARFGVLAHDSYVDHSKVDPCDPSKVDYPARMGKPFMATTGYAEAMKKQSTMPSHYREESGTMHHTNAKYHSR